MVLPYQQAALQCGTAEQHYEQLESTRSAHNADVGYCELQLLVNTSLDNDAPLWAVQTANQTDSAICKGDRTVVLAG